jgi:hypothetical protein
MKKNVNSRLAIWAGIAVYAAASIVGLVRFFSPVPLADAWKGQIDWWLNLGSRGIIGFWDSLNEHRPVLSRVAYVVDNSWFGGTGAFMAFCNVALLLTFVYFLVKTFNDTYPDASKTDTLLFGALSFGTTFSLFQRESITWSFNIHFVLLFLFPLIAYRAFGRWLQAEGNSTARKDLSLYVLFGILAMCTLASGTSAFLVGAIAALFFGKRKLAVVSLALGIALIALYFTGLSNSNDGGMLSHFSPLVAIQYFLLLLANPFWQFAPQSGAGLYLCLAIGVAVLVALVLAVWRLLLSPKRSTRTATFALMICYATLSLLFVAAGRSHFGLWQAGMSRYATPVLALYACLLAVYLGGGSGKKLARAIVAGFLVLLLGTQVVFATRDNVKMYQYAVASVAIDLGVNDESAIAALSVKDVGVFEVSKAAEAANTSVFAGGALAQIRKLEAAGQAQLSAGEPCKIWISDSSEVARGWYRLTGNLARENLPATVSPAYFAAELNGGLAFGAVSSRFLNKSAGSFVAYSHQPATAGVPVTSRCDFNLK